MKKINIEDGFNSELVSDAYFAGILEMPVLQPHSKFIIPEIIVPFSVRNRCKNPNRFISFYEHDIKFGDVIANPQKYIDEFRNIPGIISPDCSLYRDMPLIAQLANIYRSRANAYYYAKNGAYVVPNVRWGDERTYTDDYLPEKAAFLGIPKNDIVSIGTYGCIKGKENKYHFKSGLDAMLKELTPKIVLVYGTMPQDIFEPFINSTEFIRYDDWVTVMHRK